MPKFKPNKGFKMKSPLKNTGTMLPEVKVSGGKAGKSRAQRDYDKKLEKEASIEYDKSRAFSTEGGPGQYGKLTEKKKNIYRAKAKKRKKKSATPKKSPYKAGQTAGQIIRRERHMV